MNRFTALLSVWQRLKNRVPCYSEHMSIKLHVRTLMGPQCWNHWPENRASSPPFRFIVALLWVCIRRCLLHPDEYSALRFVKLNALTKIAGLCSLTRSNIRTVSLLQRSFLSNSPISLPDWLRDYLRRSFNQKDYTDYHKVSVNFILIKAICDKLKHTNYNIACS
jgi:hypothetical protein